MNEEASDVEKVNPEVEKCKICYSAESTTSVSYDNEQVPACSPCKEQFNFDNASHKIKPLIEQLFNEANQMGGDLYNQKAFVDSIIRQHRTLQQSFFQWIVALINKYAEMEENGWYDARNEDTVKACKELAEVLKGKGFRFI